MGTLDNGEESGQMTFSQLTAGGDQVLNSFTPHSETESGDCSEEDMSMSL